MDPVTGRGVHSEGKSGGVDAPAFRAELTKLVKVVMFANVPEGYFLQVIKDRQFVAKVAMGADRITASVVEKQCNPDLALALAQSIRIQAAPP